MESGTLNQTLFLLSLIRLIQPNILLPATTALGTIDPKGREKGILAGANVVMPNLSPVSVRKNMRCMIIKFVRVKKVPNAKIVYQNV